MIDNICVAFPGAQCVQFFVRRGRSRSSDQRSYFFYPRPAGFFFLIRMEKYWQRWTICLKAFWYSVYWLVLRLISSRVWRKSPGYPIIIFSLRSCNSTYTTRRDKILASDFFFLISGVVISMMKINLFLCSSADDCEVQEGSSSYYFLLILLSFYYNINSLWIYFFLKKYFIKLIK